MFKFKKPKPDMRFLDPESLRLKSGLRQGPANINAISNSQVSNLSVNYVAEDVQAFSSHDTWVKVEQGEVSSNQDMYSFLELITTGKTSSSSSNADANNHAVDKSEVTKKIGVFSDSKIYSALIQSLLSPYSLDIGHFNHPNTFVKEKFSEFDEVSAWVIFLSDEDESDFLDQFLNRYEDKPTLFLFPKMQRSNCQSTINDFILEHGFIEEDVAVC